jgi:hypothetical protein
VVKVTIGGGGEFKGSETDIVEGFVINDHTFISVFNQLMDGEGSIVRFNDGVGDFGGGDNGEGDHHSVGVFFSDLRDKEGSHSGTGSSSEGVGDWNPWRQSHPSASFLTTSRTESISSAPSV